MVATPGPLDGPGRRYDMSAANGGGQQLPTAKRTIPDLLAMKRDRARITMLTAYDAAFARLVDASGVDIILVGDSLGMVVLGHPPTVPGTMDDMLRACGAVARGP